MAEMEGMDPGLDRMGYRMSLAAEDAKALPEEEDTGADDTGTGLESFSDPEMGDFELDNMFNELRKTRDPGGPLRIVVLAGKEAADVAKALIGNASASGQKTLQGMMDYEDESEDESSTEA